MRRNVLIPVVMIVAAAIVAVVVAASGDDDTDTRESSEERLVREDSIRLSSATDDRVTFVEFLDFECESCAAAYPAVETLRET